ncbi:hypothetical protein F5Y05DRAFT_404654 [Hypoxylon sp. FL0543]|nr:hypothetical protein F5Y05DRAFT_404654 [Hypoxylon sp. FL0543]
MHHPNFVPDMALPRFDLDALVAKSQQTHKTSSQMSPLGSTTFSDSQSPGQAYNIQLELNHSDSSGPGGSSIGLQGLSSAQKPEGEQLVIPPDEDFAGPGDWGMEIDENGDILELGEPAIVQRDPDLPGFPTVERENQAQADSEHQDQPIVDDQGDSIMADEAQVEAQPEAEAPPEHQRSDDHDAFLPDPQPRPAPSRRKRKARTLHADEETQITRTAIQKWQDDYLTNCGTRKVRTFTSAQAKTNAMLLTFGLGLGNIGQNLSVPGMLHPLALEFSGDSLFTTLTGLSVPELGRGTRRTASEAIEDDDEQNGRRVRPRLEGDFDQQGRGVQGSGVVDQDAQIIQDSPEVGREAQAPMSDHLSSALRMPWNRGSSLVPGSSIRGSAQKGRTPSSPLGNRGNIQDLVHYSDGPGLSNDGFDLGMGAPPSQDDSFDGFNLAAAAAAAPERGEEQEAPKEGEWPALDTEGANFLSFIGTAVRESGERRLDEDFDVDRRWVAFDDVFLPRQTGRATAAQAFYHALCLASKGKLEVQQDGGADEPFGGIWVGVRMRDVVSAGDEQ